MMKPVAVIIIIAGCIMQPLAGVAVRVDIAQSLLEVRYVKRKSLQGDPCPVARSLDLIGDWWSLLIIRDALAGTRRFSDFQKSLEVAKNILSIRLKGLVAQGVMDMVPAADGSVYKEYVLTAKGRALQTVLIALSQWGNEFMYEPGELGSVMVDAKNRKPIQKLELVAADGRHLAPDEVATRLGVPH